MKVYFSANHRDIKRDKKVYDRILHAVRSNGHVLINNWVEAAWFINQTVHNDKRDWNSFCQVAEKGIQDADVVIVEASGASSFGAGYQAALAVMNEKPTLFLIAHDKKEISYASGLAGPNILVEEYDESTVEACVSDYLRGV